MPDDVLAPRPRFLSRALDSFADEAFFTRDEPLENPSEVLQASGKDAELWREMRRSELSISSAVALRTKKVTSHGGGFVAGSGDRAELLRRVAEGIWAVPKRKTVELEVVRSWACGFTVHEAIDVRVFRVDGKEYLGPKKLKRRSSVHYGFTRDDDLVILAGTGDLSEDKIFRTESTDRAADKVKWLVSPWGHSGNPFGEAVLEDVWIEWRLLGEYRNGLKAGLLSNNGLLQIKKTGLSGAGVTDNLSVSEAKKAAEEMNKIRMSSGVLVGVRGYEGEVIDARAAGGAWLDAIKEMTAEIRRRILGSETPQAAPAVGSFALAKVQDEAPEAFGRFDADVAGENITRYVLPWLEINFPGETFDEEELPCWQSNMGKVPTLERMQALAAGGVELDGRELAKRWKGPLLEKDPEAVITFKAPAPAPVVAPADEEEDEEPVEDPDEAED